jgi:hypothetical protein
MAILRGFPPSNTISPSVRIAESDQSFIAPEQSFHRAGLVGFASKGPINSPTIIATQRQLNTVFGYPHPEVGDPYLIYAASQYLLVANELFVVRVADIDPVSDEQATTASVDVLAAGSIIDIFSNTSGPYSFSTDSFFRWRLNGALNHKTLVVVADTNRPSPDAGQPWTTVDLVAELNSQIDTQNDGVEFYVKGSGAGARVGFRSTWAYGPNAQLELVSVQDAAYTVIGIGTGMTVGQVTGTTDRYPNDGYTLANVWNFTGLTGMFLNVVVDGTDNVLIDDVVQTIDLSNLEGASWNGTQVVQEINDQIATLPGGFEAVKVGNNIVLRTLHKGRDARLLVKSDSSSDAVLGLPNTTGVGDSPLGVTGDVAIHTFGRVDGAENTTGLVSFTLTAESPGIEGNNTSVLIKNDTTQGTFQIEVYNNGVQMEAWGNLTKDQSSRFYVETFLALVSDFVRVTDNTAVGAPPAPTALTGLALTGGSDGIPSDPDKQDEILIGNLLGYTGIYTFSEPEQIDIDLIAVPGHASTSVVTALLDLCQNVRQDCLAIIDPPFGLTVSEIIAWQNGSHPLNLTRFDSDFGALYWPWVKMRDNYNRVDVWVPPSGSVMATYARSDFLSAPWYAPAGLTRGVVPGITDVFNRPTLGERDLMYGYRNCINPIVQFADVDGFVIWGQKTLQRTPTALDRVNVRRLLFVCEKRIRVASRSLLFDPHDDIFRAKFVALASDILREIQVGRGINAFIVKADTELNTPDVIDRNEFRARIGIQPVRAAEFMFIEFSVHRTGSFAENANTF